jgi:decaprenyl-phosphate phosphoribosyltransferase
MPEVQVAVARAPTAEGVAVPPGGSAPATEATAPAQPARSGRGRVRAVVDTLRPKQWLKNVLVIAAAGAAGALGRDDVPVRVCLAFAAFCLLASGLYAINDVRDAPEDRLHPLKRHRPVAAGELAPRTAVVIGLILIAGGIALCAAIRPLLAVVGVGYVVLTLSYTLIWRHLLLFDVAAIAGGFVLRAVAGGVAAPVGLSRWFLLVVTFAAVFVAAGKRWAELQRTEAGAQGRRRVLALYTERRLRMILALSTTGALIAYCVWAFQVPAVNGIPWRPLSIAPVALALARYSLLVFAGGGEAPEELVLHDRVLLVAGVAWLALFALGVHAVG